MVSWGSGSFENSEKSLNTYLCRSYSMEVGMRGFKRFHCEIVKQKKRMLTWNFYNNKIFLTFKLSNGVICKRWWKSLTTLLILTRYDSLIEFKTEITINQKNNNKSNWLLQCGFNSSSFLVSLKNSLHYILS